MPNFLQGVEDQGTKALNFVKGIGSSIQNRLNQGYQNDPLAGPNARALAANQTSISPGVPAKAPEQNIPPAQKTLPALQARTTAPVAPKQQVASTQTLPQMAKLQATNMATLYGPNGVKQAVKIGSPEASALQTQGYGLTPNSYVAPKTGGNTGTTAPPTDISSKGILTSLVNTSKQGAPVTGQAETGLLNTAQTNPGSSGPAYQKAQDINNQIQQLDNEYAQKRNDINAGPADLDFKTGELGRTQDLYTAQRAALTNQLNAETTLNSQNISGVQTQQSGYTNAGSLGNTAQGLVQSGLATAGGYAQPVQSQYGTPLVNPQTGQVMSGAGTTVGNSALNPISNVDSIATQVLNGQISPSQAAGMGGTVANWQSLLNAAIQKQNPSYNYNAGAGVASGQTSAAQTQSAQVQQMTSSLQQGQNLQAQLKDLLTTYNINPNTINKANEGLQLLAKNTSSSQYQALSNLTTDLISTYSSILTPGATTDTARSLAASLLDPTASGKTIAQTLSDLDEQAKAKIAGVSTSGGAGTNTTATGASLYDF